MESAPTGSSHRTPEEPGHERLQYLQNREQSNVYRTPEARAAVREFEKVLLGSNRQMRRREAAEAADVSLLTARKVWRALGFPNIDDDEVFFTPSDCEALETIVDLNRSHDLEEESTISITRSVGQLTDRMVAWQIETLVEDIVKTKGYTDSQARQELLALLPELIEELEAILLYGYRRQLSAAVLRLALRSDQNDANDPSLLPLVRGVGFADLVSYTSLSRRMNEKNLTELVKTFEQRCAEVVAAGGGRIIKTIGDEVMFLTETPEAAARISMALSKEIQSDPHLPDARVAFVWGRILPKLGDIYGPSVNLASRLVAVADPGVVVTDKITADTLENDPRFVLTPQRVRDIRGFGEIWPVALTPGIGNELEIDF